MLRVFKLLDMRNLDIKLFIILAIVFCNLLRSQSVKAEYDFQFKNYFSNKSYNFKSVLFADIASKNKMYQVQFGITDENTQKISEDVQGISSYRSKLKPTYTLFSTVSGEYLIADTIDKEEYILSDIIPPMNWLFSSETKLRDTVVLNRAQTSFRGRDYTVWYKKDEKITILPWKFNNLAGIIYEIYDSSNEYSWILTKLMKTPISPLNPFLNNKKEVKSYLLYPQLRYGLSERMQIKVQENPLITLREQRRNGLEIKFEWEEQ